MAASLKAHAISQNVPAICHKSGSYLLSSSAKHFVKEDYEPNIKAINNNNNKPDSVLAHCNKYKCKQPKTNKKDGVWGEAVGGGEFLFKLCHEKNTAYSIKKYFQKRKQTQ